MDFPDEQMELKQEMSHGQLCGSQPLSQQQQTVNGPMHPEEEEFKTSQEPERPFASGSCREPADSGSLSTKGAKFPLMSLRLDPIQREKKIVEAQDVPKKRRGKYQGRDHPSSRRSRNASEALFQQSDVAPGVSQPAGPSAHTQQLRATAVPPVSQQSSAPPQPQLATHLNQHQHQHQQHQQQLSHPHPQSQQSHGHAPQQPQLRGYSQPPHQPLQTKHQHHHQQQQQQHQRQQPQHQPHPHIPTMSQQLHPCHPAHHLTQQDRNALRAFREQSQILKKEWKHPDSDTCKDLGDLPGVETNENGFVRSLQWCNEDIEESTRPKDKQQLCLCCCVSKIVVSPEQPLDDKQLTGTLEHLGNLTALEKLRLTKIKLTGTLEHLGNLTVLRVLALSENCLKGTLEHLGNLTALTYLDLSENRLKDTLEHLGNLTALTYLDLSKNRLKGTLEHLGNLTALKSLHLGGNQLTGTVKHIGNTTALEMLILSKNELTGNLEPLKNLKALESLYLNGNQLTGSLQPLGNLTKLTVLNLWSNKLGLYDLESCDDARAEITLDYEIKEATIVEIYSGPQPSDSHWGYDGSTLWVENGLRANFCVTFVAGEGDLKPLEPLKALEDLDLGENKLTGTVKPLGNLKALKDLHLNGNQLTGSLEPLFGLQKLNGLKLSGNKFEFLKKGDIPPCIRKLQENIEEFVTPGGIPTSGVSGWFARAVTIFSVVMTYVDILTDVYAATRFFKEGHYWWFGLALAFILISGFMGSVLSPGRLYQRSFDNSESPHLDRLEVFLRTLSILQLRLLYDSYDTLCKSSETQGFVTMKYAEVIFEAVPQLWLQMYVTLKNYEGQGISYYLVLSIVCSSISLAWNITCLLDREKIQEQEQKDKHKSCLQRKFHKAWLLLICTGYHIGEIAVQVCLLGLATYLLQKLSFFTLLPYLCLKSFLIYRIGQSTVKRQMPENDSLVEITRQMPETDDLVEITSKVIGGVYFESVWQKEKSFKAGFVWNILESTVMISGILSGAFVPIDGQSNAPVSNVLIVVCAGLVLKILFFKSTCRLHYPDNSTMVKPESSSDFAV